MENSNNLESQVHVDLGVYLSYLDDILSQRHGGL